METYKHKYKNSNTFDKMLLDNLLYEDLTLLQYNGILNGETINDLAFWAGVSPLYLKELMDIHNNKVKLIQQQMEKK